MALITHPSNSSEDLSASLRESLLELKMGSEHGDEGSESDQDLIVRLDPMPSEPKALALKGLALKRAAAAVDPAQPLKTVRALNAWLATGRCKKVPLRLKTPGEGEPFMSRSRFSAKDSLLFDHDVDHDVREQIAAYEQLHSMAGCRSPEWPRALNEALATLEAYLDALPPGKSFHAVKDQERYACVKDTRELRRLLQAVEVAMSVTPPTISTFSRGNDPQGNASTSSDSEMVLQASRLSSPPAGASDGQKDRLIQLLNGRPVSPIVLPPHVLQQMDEIIATGRQRTQRDEQQIELSDEERSSPGSSGH